MPLIIYMEGQIKIVLKGDKVIPWEPLIRKKRIVPARDMEGRPVLVNAKNIILAIEKDQKEYDSEIEQQKQLAIAQPGGKKLVNVNLTLPHRGFRH